MIEKQIELIKRQISKLDDDDFDINAWKSSTTVILGRIFGETYPGIKEINKIQYKSGGIATTNASSFWNNLESCIKQGKDILEACITELEIFGLPEKKQNEQSGININLTQNQNQSVNINLLVSALEDELTVSQFREVNDLMKTDEPKSEKKRKIIDKIKSFGNDVASNILANILTNPNIWG
ncbi:hypothetical protein [Elizabethkingia anophelis]|uniref:AbiTii domain-containing protein n=1 Tax=Elizabethkingia anophelis TaxID=1117645 RepID=A0A494GIF5_9FLAO|nr:hypothetical protein [Elizabethkingia anophelis]AQX51846.1 hypothetical protein AYC66_14645 [Elizabethkingia anophelis]MCT4196137.1 hypothetical protein [Elizabethkingia anophelis]MCT4225918.1 hypothetical protein [Elizabethkingia anophelis]MCT4307509.1 hypothetical protein [Elizabethkingia anophelis]MDV2473265.1 hypothetical protein [Elizabethkingia anophelis]